VYRSASECIGVDRSEIDRTAWVRFDLHRERLDLFQTRKMSFNKYPESRCFVPLTANRGYLLAVWADKATLKTIRKNF